MLERLQIFVGLFPNQKVPILGLLTATESSQKIEKELKKHYSNKIKFGNNFHSRCCEHYKIRYKKDNEMICDENYCLSYGKDKFAFTKEWVDFLSNELKNKDKFLEIFPNKKDLIIN